MKSRAFLSIAWLAASMVCQTPASTAGVVISQVYGGGGNTGAIYANDFIELFNAGSESVSLTGWSVQYAPSSGTFWQSTSLPSAVLQPGEFLLVAEASGGANGSPLPTPDVMGSINMSSTSGQIALVANTTLLSSTCPLGAPVADFVGYGIATCFEGSGAVAATSNSTAAKRKDSCVDTDDNAVDFSVAAPSPANSATAFDDCSRIFADGFE